MSTTANFAMVAKNMNDLEVLLIQSGGEHTLEVQELFREIVGSVDTSAEMIARCESAGEHFRKISREYAAIASGFEKSESFIREMIKADMIAHDQCELIGKLKTFKLVNSKPKLVIDEANLDSKYQMHVLQPDKRKIEEALSLGIEVKGAQLVEVKALRSSINKKAVTNE